MQKNKDEQNLSKNCDKKKRWWGVKKTSSNLDTIRNIGDL